MIVFDVSIFLNIDIILKFFSVLVATSIVSSNIIAFGIKFSNKFDAHFKTKWVPAEWGR